MLLELDDNVAVLVKSGMAWKVSFGVIVKMVMGIKSRTKSKQYGWVTRLSSGNPDGLVYVRWYDPTESPHATTAAKGSVPQRGAKPISTDKWPRIADSNGQVRVALDRPLTAEGLSPVPASDVLSHVVIRWSSGYQCYLVDPEDMDYIVRSQEALNSGGTPLGRDFSTRRSKGFGGDVLEETTTPKDPQPRSHLQDPGMPICDVRADPESYVKKIVWANRACWKSMPRQPEWYKSVVQSVGYSRRLPVGLWLKFECDNSRFKVFFDDVQKGWKSEDQTMGQPE